MERIGGAVRSELGRFGTAGAMADLVAAWPGAVGDAVATNAWPARFARDGTLHVAASSSAWAFELGQLESEILARLKDALGKAAPSRLSVRNDDRAVVIATSRELQRDVVGGGGGREKQDWRSNAVKAALHAVEGLGKVGGKIRAARAQS